MSKIKQEFNVLSIQNNTLQQKNESLKISNNELKIQNTSLEQNDIHDNYQEVQQHGQNNFNQGVIKGNFIYNK